ncbi:MAG: DNA-binding protein WhiA [Phascolarctobacterium faecium]
MRNNVNRVVNCETANLNKVVQAAVQRKHTLYEKHLGLGKLPLTLRETAELRLNHPDASLNELADLSEGKIGKSGINHRLKKYSI